jgi:hypothetical protein
MVGSVGGTERGGNEAHSLAILPVKKSRKEEARCELEGEEGSVLGEDLERRESRQDQSFFG